MCSCDQSLGTSAFLWEKLSKPQFYKDLTRKTDFLEGWSWFKSNDLGLALGTNLKFYTSVAKGLKLKVKKFWGLNHTFVEVTGEKLVGGPFCPTPPPSLPSWIGLNIGKNKIDSSTEVSLLGVKIDKQLKSKSHIEERRSKAAYKLHALGRIRKYLTVEKAKLLANAFINSQFTYAPLIWMFAGKSSFAKICKIHFRTLQVVYNNYDKSYHDLWCFYPPEALTILSNWSL